MPTMFTAHATLGQFFTDERPQSVDPRLAVHGAPLFASRGQFREVG